MKRDSTVFVLSGVHNSLTHTKELLTCIDKQSYSNVQTVIVDDGSTDGTSIFISKNYPQVTVISGDGSLWWTGCLAKGIDHILPQAHMGDYILTVNDDCTFDEKLVKTLVTESVANDRAIVGSLAIDSRNRKSIIDAGVRLDWIRGKVVALGPKLVNDLPKTKTVRDDIDTVTTKGTLYPAEVFNNLGNFDVLHLPHYLSDYEFGCRAKRAGWKLLLSFQARVYNDTQRTGIGDNSRLRLSMLNMSRLFFWRKSKLNIADQFWFIWLCCPLRFRFRNYLIVSDRFIRHLLGLM